MYGIRYREEIKDPAVVKELDDFFAWIKGYLGTSLNEDGTLRLLSNRGQDINGDTSIVQQIEAEEGHWWKRGPWIFDTPTSHDAFIYTPTLPASTINDFAPRGIDTAIGIEFNLGGNISITGIKAPAGNYRRLLVIRNQSASSTITLKHANTSSAELNRFDNPGAVDIVVGSKQTAWLYYDADNRRWGQFITGNTSGGLVGAPSTSLPSGITASGDVTGPGSSTDGNVVVFNGATGKIIKDGGTVASFLGTAAVLIANLTLTDAQIKAGNTTPQTIIAAPGSNKIAVPFHFSLTKDSSAGVYSASPTIRVRYAGNTTDIIDAAVAWTLTGANKTHQTVVRTAGQSFTYSSFDPTNKAVQFSTSADVTGGNIANSAKLSIAYYIVNSI